ncbi:hypothetical protein BX616_000690 [Lobosporangium transversale]|nr:hypothetical protein BX616_000690 [Lobosporangium transversale]
MFRTLAPKLGSKPPLQQGALGNNSSANNTDQGRRNINATPSTVANLHSTVNNITIPHVVRPGDVSQTGQGSSLSRQTNPFAKGFIGTRSTNSPSTKSSTAPINNTVHQPVIEMARNTSSDRRNQQVTIAVKGGHVSSVQQKPENLTKQSMGSKTPPSDPDASFNADDFLLGSDGLALTDLIDGLHENKDEVSLSWTPTPPRIQKPSLSGTIQPLSIPKGDIVLRSSTSPTSTGASVRSANLMGSTSDIVPEKENHTSTGSSSTHSLSSPSGSVGLPIISDIGRRTTYSNRSSTPRVLAPNSQEHPSNRPNEEDTIDHRLVQKNERQLVLAARNLQDHERRGLMRSQSSPSTGSNPSPLPMRSRRRLPGPAGELPVLSEEEKRQLFQSRGTPFNKEASTTAAGSISPNSSIKKKMKAAVYNGPVDSMFTTAAWEQMLRTYGLPDYKPSTLAKFKGITPLVEHTLSDIENRQELHRGKISSLVVMIKDVVLTEIDASVTLLDPSGEMRGTVHRTVLEQYKNNEIRAGTVLALKNVSVFSPTPISHYLIITSRNIVGMFLPQPAAIILSQGSTQERFSQKRKRGQGSQESDSSRGSWVGSSPGILNGNGISQSLGGKNDTQQPLTINSSSASNASNLSSASLSLQISTAESMSQRSISWSATPEDTGTVLENAGSMNSVPLGQNRTIVKAEGTISVATRRATDIIAASSLPTAQEQTKDESSLSSPRVSQTQEVQFQSLRQTIGDASAQPVVHGQTQSEDITATPLISLGVMTPNVLRAETPNIAKGESRRVLSSFAAPPSLRKRSSHSNASQKSDSATSSSSTSAVVADVSASTNASKKSIRSKSHLTPTPSRKAILRRQPSSSDWLDDLGEDDLAGALDDDRNLSLTEPPAPVVHRVQETASVVATTTTTTINATATTAAKPSIEQDEDDDDDLDNLLDGLDDYELFDI